MKRFVLFLLVLTISFQLFALTEISIEKFDDKVYAVYIFSGNSSDEEMYGTGIVFIPETKTAPPIIYVSLMKNLEGKTVYVSFDDLTCTLQIMCNDDLSMKDKVCPKFLLGYADKDFPDIATIACREDYDYLLSLLKRNNGNCELSVIAGKDKIFNFNLEYSQEEFESLLELASIVNLGEIPEGGV